MIRYVLLVGLLCASPALAQDNVKLKPGPGLDAVTTSCSVCHTLNYIRMNSVFLTPEAWKAEVAKMFGIKPANFSDCFFDVDGEPLVQRLIGLARLSQERNLPILFQ